MSEDLILIGIGILGIVFHQLKRYLKQDVKVYPKSMTTDQIKASELRTKKQKIASSLSSIIMIVLIVLLRDDPAVVAQVKITRISIAVLGLSGDSVFMGMLEAFKPKLKPA